jgi:hypothetical protein
MKPQNNLQMKTNLNDSAIMLKVHPGLYTIMIHDPSLIPISTGIQDAYRIVQKDLAVPNIALPNGTMQYAMVSMKEKFLMMPRRIGKVWFGPEKACRY